MSNALATVCRVLVLCGVLSCLLTGCDSGEQPADSAAGKPRLPAEICEYVLQYGPTGWEGEVLINSFPRVIDSMSGSFGITHLLKSGKNSLHVSVRPEPAGAASEFHASVVKLTIRQTEPAKDDPPARLVRQEILKRETVAEITVSAADEGTSDATATFSADVPVKFAWQNADKIEVLTEEDKKEIYGYFRRLNEALLREDAKGACASLADIFRTLWEETKKPSGVYVGDAVLKAQDKTLKKLFSHKGHFVSLAKENALVFQKYDRAVRISARDSDILRAGVPEADRDAAGEPSVSFPTAVFVKIKGRWVFFGR